METSNRFGVDNQYVIITISIRKVRGRCLSYQGRCLSTAITQKSTSLPQTKYKNSVIHSPQKCYHEKKNILIFYPESLWCVRNWWRLSSTLCLFNIVTPSSLSGFQGETTFEQSRSLTKGIFCRRFLLFLDFLRFLSLLQNFWQNSVTHVPLWVGYDKIYWG